jgi:hypothetical protein
MFKEPLSSLSSKYLHPPEYATRSMLASMLADRIMTEKAFVAVTPVVEGDDKEENGGISITGRTPLSNADLSRFESFAVERELLQHLFSKILGVGRRMVSQTGLEEVLGLDGSGGEEKAACVKTQGDRVVDPTIRYIWAINRLVVGKFMALAAWVGGALLPASHVLLLCSSYAIITKRGPRAFVGAALFIKALSLVYN